MLHLVYVFHYSRGLMWHQLIMCISIDRNTRYVSFHHPTILRSRKALTFAMNEDTPVYDLEVQINSNPDHSIEIVAEII